MARRVRIIGVLGTLVALNALFVLAVLWGFLELLPTVVVTVLSGDVSTVADAAKMPVGIPVYAALVVLFLGGQLYYGYQRVLADTRGVASEPDHEIRELVGRLAMTASVPEPNVRVIEDETPSCYTVGRFTDATVIVTTGLVTALDESELEAVLAHEIAHIANRDVTLMTITTLFLEIADRSYNLARLVPRALTDMDDLSFGERMALRWFLPLTVLVYLLVSPVLLVFPKLADWATTTLSHAREFAADAASAQLTGNPLALATALVTLAETTPTPETDLRVSRTQTLCIVPTDPVSGSPTTSPPPVESAGSVDRDESVSTWLADSRTAKNPASGTHPPVSERVERLQDIAVEMEAEA